MPIYLFRACVNKIIFFRTILIESYILFFKKGCVQKFWLKKFIKKVTLKKQYHPASKKMYAILRELN